MIVKNALKALVGGNDGVLRQFRGIRAAKITLEYYAAILFYRLRYRGESIFQVIHRKRSWGDSPSASGGGSDLVHTSAIRDALPALIRDIGARSMLDAPCGDFYWMQKVPLNVESYIGADIVPELIQENKSKYEHGIYRFMHADIVRDALPKVDLILCRDCMIHLSNQDIAQCLANFKRSGATYLLASTYPGRVRRNWNIVTGMWRPVDLQLPPFSFPEPIRFISESSSTPTEKQALSLWRIADLPV